MPEKLVRSIERDGKRHLVVPRGSRFGYRLYCLPKIRIKRGDITEVLPRYIDCPICRGKV